MIWLDPQSCLSKPAEAMRLPSGLNLEPNTSPCGTHDSSTSVHGGGGACVWQKTNPMARQQHDRRLQRRGPKRALCFGRRNALASRSTAPERPRHSVPAKYSVQQSGARPRVLEIEAQGKCIPSRLWLGCYPCHLAELSL